MGLRPEAQREIVRLARAQHGAITGDQLLMAGLSRDAIRARVERGRIVRVFRGVYVLGDPALIPLAISSAALLLYGSDAYLSHRSAAALWDLIAPDAAVTQVTVIGGYRRPRSGLRLHRVCQLDPDDVSLRNRLRVTALARALIDFATEATSAELADAFGEARAKHRLGEPALDAALRRAPANHPGAAIVRRMLREPGSTYERSKAERLMRSLLRQAGLPQPTVNSRLQGHTADFLWPAHRLIVEVDGYGTHGNRHAFELDRKRDQVHIAAGYVVIRVTWRQLTDEPLAVVARLAQALAHRAAA